MWVGMHMFCRRNFTLINLPQNKVIHWPIKSDRWLGGWDALVGARMCERGPRRVGRGQDAWARMGMHG